MQKKLKILVAMLLTIALLPTCALAGPLAYGDSGSNVKKVQTRLTELGYYTGAVDGKFDKDVRSAVKFFQEANGLPVTGEVNTATRKKMESEKAVAKKTSSSSQTSGTLAYGTTSDAVKTMQEKLAGLGFFSGAADGKFDAETRDAVSMFQRANKLDVTGKADAKTRKLLDSDAAISKDTYYATVPVGSGDSGYAVKLVQQRLTSLGYYTGSVDGKYGSSTVTAAKHFQKNNNLTVTGNCDYKTRVAMNSSSAVRKNGTALVSAKPSASSTAALATPTPAPTATPAPSATKAPTSAGSSKIETVIAAAQAQLGKPYIFATSGMSSFDCSGLTMYCFGLVGIKLSHSAQSQGYQSLTRLTANQLVRGDLLVFNTNTRDADLADHVGIYLGDGNFIHASSAKGKVYISSLSDYTPWFSWGLRLL